MRYFIPRIKPVELKEEMKKVVERAHLFEVFKKNQANIKQMKQLFVGDFFRFLAEQDKKGTLQSRNLRL